MTQADVLPAISPSWNLCIPCKISLPTKGANPVSAVLRLQNVCRGPGDAGTGKRAGRYSIHPMEKKMWSDILFMTRWPRVAGHFTEHLSVGFHYCFK